MKLPFKQNLLFKTFIFLTFLITFLISAFISSKQILAQSEPSNSSDSSEWNFRGKRNISEKYTDIDPKILLERDTLRLVYDLHGSCLLEANSSEIIFDQPVGRNWRSISLSDYGQDCLDGEQIVDIPLSDFKGLNTQEPVGKFHARFQHFKDYYIEIKSAVVFNSRDSTMPQLSKVRKSKKPSPVPTSKATPTPTLTPTPSLSPTPLVLPNIEECQIIAANWDTSNSSVTEGTEIDLRVDTIGDCSNGRIKFEIREADFPLGSNPVSINPTSQPIVNNTAIGSWVAEHQQDGPSGITDPPEYYFVASLVGETASYTSDPPEIKVYKISSPEPSPTITPLPTLKPALPSPSPLITPSPTPQPAIGNWEIQSTSSMKITKDVICNQKPRDYIESWVDKAKELGVNYVALETPYDNPYCGDSVAYTKTWIEVLRTKGLKVWHRHTPLQWEGLYDTPKTTNPDFINLISDYILEHPDFFDSGDIFTPIPEPQNGGIAGITYCPYNICQFDNAADFNSWLRKAMDASQNSFDLIGLSNKIKVGYFGFDGFVAWGDNNPDWDGILEDETVDKMGNVTIDHYPEIVGSTMEEDLREVSAKFPGVPIIIGEWGAIEEGDLEQTVVKTMSAAKKPYVVGFNYWHMGVGGHEALVEDDLTKKPHFDEVQSFFQGL